jgi:hypothetical protein
MNLKQVITLSALALAAGATLADDAPLTRAEVKNQVLAARAAGTLMPAGEATEPSYVVPAASTVTRTQVKAEARQVYATKARAVHEFEVAGNNTQALDYARAAAAPSQITRSEMKATTLAARSQGELMGAGEQGYRADNYPESHASSPPMKFHELFASLRAKL